MMFLAKFIIEIVILLKKPNIRLWKAVSNELAGFCQLGFLTKNGLPAPSNGESDFPNKSNDSD